MNRDGARKSIWQEEIKSFPAKNNLQETFDIAIVGAGITGVSTAYRLQKSGKKCILLESANLGFGTTGGTTAHLNTFFDTTYAEAIKDFGIDNAKLLAKAAGEALQIIHSNILENNIECDFKKKKAHLFALDEKQEKQLEDLVEGAEKAGVKMNYVNKISYPFAFSKAVEIPDQGQFHPIKYIKSLAEAYLTLGGIIKENCLCESHEEDKEAVTLKTSGGMIKARHIVYATHIPPGLSVLHFMNAPYRSYVMAFTLKNKEYPEELGYDLTDPYHYYRVQEVNGEKLLIAGGEDHKTGHSEDTGECFSRLENYIRKHFEVDLVKYSWSSQYYEPVDGLPYIGVLPESKGKIFTATGFRGNGMIFGTLSSKIISDLINTGTSKFEKLFHPSRIKPIAGFSEFMKESAAVAVDFVKDKLFTERIHSFAEIAEGEAKVVRFEGKSYALYKEKGGKTHILRSSCPHAKCDVRWNSAEISWDCPCHGSRFNVNGKVLTAPSAKNLIRIDEDEL